MGQGRQKAKHTKVARQLKYYSPDTDLSQLERELSGASQGSEEDAWAEYAAKYNDDYADREDYQDADN